MQHDFAERYRRQTAFAPFGEEGQRRLQRARVLVVGCGALGGTVAELLVRAGTGIEDGKITLIDFDVVQPGNLHRQTLFTQRHAVESRYKVEAAREVLLSIDGRANLDVVVGRFNETTASMLESFELLIDATDDFSSRFDMNRAAIRYGKPLITAGVSGASGQILTIFPGRTACLECFLDPSVSETAPNDSSYGILPATPQFFAAWEVMEALKILSGHPDACNSKLFSVDLWNNRLTPLDIRRDPRCPACGG